MSGPLGDVPRTSHGSRRAVVIARWADDTALVRTDGGDTVEVPVPQDLRPRFDVGAEVRLDPAAARILGLARPDTV